MLRSPDSQHFLMMNIINKSGKNARQYNTCALPGIRRIIVSKDMVIRHILLFIQKGVNI